MTDLAFPAWPQIAALIDAAPFPVEVAPPSPEAMAELAALSIGEGTSLGAMVAKTGGMLIDHGWARLLGSNSARLGRSLVSWNADQGIGKGGPVSLLVVGDDILGGLFALDGGAFGGERGMAWYFGPDTLAWEPLNCGYTALLHLLLGSGLDAFYAEHRWPGWEAEIDAVPGDRAVFLTPPLWAVGPAIPERTRGAVPMAEMLTNYRSLLPQLKPNAPQLFPTVG